MVTISAPLMVEKAEHIPYVTAEEAYSLMKVQFERLLALLEKLTPDDWSHPTACTEWDVRAMVAHQAGSYASGSGYGEMIRQYGVLPRPGKLPEDLVNERQVGERADRSPQDLIAELRRVGPLAIENWAYRFRLAKLLTIPHPVAGMFSLRHLMWVIHSRDTWMHRLDICRATGQPFEQTAEQDGRIVALVMLDVARALQKKLGGRAIVFDLTGPAGGTWQVGEGEPAAAVRMDALDFNIFASGRFSYAEARAKAQLSGDLALGENILRELLIVY